MAQVGLHAYESTDDATRGLLLEVCRLLRPLLKNYVVVGGWVPLLRTNNERLTHPGTKDVDLLLNDDRELLPQAVQTLFDAGYLPSAKHPFQLLRILNIRETSTNETKEFVFNVDLMHPAEAHARPDMFADIMELDIAEAYNPATTKLKIKSILFPSSAIVFQEKLWSPFSFEHDLPKGGRTSVEVPLLSEPGLILSKCKSVESSKRQRDAYDIYYVLSGEKGVETARALRDLGQCFPAVQKQLNNLQTYLGKESEQFNANVASYARDQAFDPLPSDFVLRALFE